ncbi:hypothetical protein BGW38_004078, partial [Lunasporangiospora selenospora]
MRVTQRDLERQGAKIRRELVRRHPFARSSQRYTRRQKERENYRQTRQQERAQEATFQSHVHFQEEQFSARKERHEALVKFTNSISQYHAGVQARCQTIRSVDERTP